MDVNGACVELCPLTMGATWQKSPSAMKGIPPKGRQFPIIVWHKLSAHSIAATLAPGNSSHAMRAASQMRSALGECSLVLDLRWPISCHQSVKRGEGMERVYIHQ